MTFLHVSNLILAVDHALMFDDLLLGEKLEQLFPLSLNIVLFVLTQAQITGLLKK